METHLDTLHTLQAWVKLYTALFLLIGLATKSLKTERNSASLLFVSPIKSTVCSQTTRICIFETVCLIATQIRAITDFSFFCKEIYISSQCFDEVPSFHFHCGCILCRPARLRQSIVALLYSGLKTRDGRGEGGRKEGWQKSESSDFSARVMKAVRTSPVKQSSKTSRTRCSALRFRNLSGSHFEKAWFLTVACFS